MATRTKKNSSAHKSAFLKQLASLRTQKLATAFGFIIGGIIPVLSFLIAHYTTGKCRWVIVAGALAYSAVSVFQAMFRILGSDVLAGIKALGFVILLECSMVFVDWSVVSYIALGVLVLFNAVSYADALVNDAKLTRAKRKARKS
jgi:hypothetical protein